MDSSAEIEDLTKFIRTHQPLCVLTGAGCSTSSGIFDYRDEEGNWKRPQPVLLHEFLNSTHSRRRYWARSMLGWPRFHGSKPSIAHKALAKLTQAGYVESLITQNVDHLHQLAGQRDTIALHGSLNTVSCIACSAQIDRQIVQQFLELHNPFVLTAAVHPDAGGESYLNEEVDDAFVVPSCLACGGILKPDVVFFGDSVDAAVRDAANNAVHQANGLLVVGSSLMVYSAYRLVKHAATNELPISIVNLGKTRGDELATLKLAVDVDTAFDEVQSRLGLA